jgi:hypothetical protein
MARLSIRQLQRSAFLAKWSKMDWSKQNCELAEEMGLGGDCIRRIRRKLGAPKPTHPRRKRKTRNAMQWAKTNLDELRGLTQTELGRKYGLSKGWRGGPLYPVLKPFLRDGRLDRQHPWQRMNFRLPNRELERIWRLLCGVASRIRREKQRPPPTWRCNPMRLGIQFYGGGQLQAYQRAVRAEERKAARYFAQASGCGGSGKAT